MYINTVSELTAITFCVPPELEALARAEVTRMLDELVAAHAGDEPPPDTTSQFQVLSAAAARTLGDSWKLPPGS